MRVITQQYPCLNAIRPPLATLPPVSAMSNGFQVSGNNSAAPFTLKVYRGEGMALLAMNWKQGRPPKDFVGFGIEYREPGGQRFFSVRNRLGFAGPDGGVDPNRLSSLRSPIQKFRWVHFPFNAELPGHFLYRVTPVFMNAKDDLSLGEPQEVAIVLHRETYPGKLNVAVTRGFVSSQAFVDNFESAGPISTLLPKKADDGLTFVPTHPKAAQALHWMGFEARHAILEVLEKAIADKKAQVRVVAYDLSEADVVSRLEKIGTRLKIIIDDDGPHGKPHSAETQAETRLKASAGADNVKRQHMGKLQHNKTIVVDGPKSRAVVCGSTNFTWRGFFVQSNNAFIMLGKKSAELFLSAFENYWENDKPAAFSKTSSAKMSRLDLGGIDLEIGFSPFSAANSMLAKIADDVESRTTSSLLYSLAFLHQTPGAMRDAIAKVTKNKNRFVYGISDRKVGGIDVQKPDGNIAPVRPEALGKNAPEPFKSEPVGGGGNRMHHKVVVIDFDKPTARVYLGSYNFSRAADSNNGENLLLVRDRRIATSYMIEAIRMIDHYHFRVAQLESNSARKKLTLKKPPRTAGEKPWWEEHYTNARKTRDRRLFA